MEENHNVTKSPKSASISSTSKGDNILENVEEQPEKVNLETEMSEVFKESRRLWVDVLIENRNPTKRMRIGYVAPKLVNGEIEIQIEEEDIESEVKFLESSLIMYVLGGDVSMNMVRQFMIKSWDFIQLPNMYYHDYGYFLLKFKTHKDVVIVIMKGPYYLRNMSMLLRE